MNISSWQGKGLICGLSAFLWLSWGNAALSASEEDRDQAEWNRAKTIHNRLFPSRLSQDKSWIMQHARDIGQGIESEEGLRSMAEARNPPRKASTEAMVFHTLVMAVPYLDQLISQKEGEINQLDEEITDLERQIGEGRNLPPDQAGRLDELIQDREKKRVRFNNLINKKEDVKNQIFDIMKTAGGMDENIIRKLK